MKRTLRDRISLADWDWLPPVLWFLIASPLLGWAFDRKVTWTWPAVGPRSWWRWDMEGDPGPEQTEDMDLRGTCWRLLDNEWVEVCVLCGGNCGQCGTSIGYGIPASMSRIVETATKEWSE